MEVLSRMMFWWCDAVGGGGAWTLSADLVDGWTRTLPVKCLNSANQSKIIECLFVFESERLILLLHTNVHQRSFWSSLTVWRLTLATGAVFRFSTSCLRSSTCRFLLPSSSVVPFVLPSLFLLKTKPESSSPMRPSGIPRTRWQTMAAACSANFLDFSLKYAKFET